LIGRGARALDRAGPLGAAHTAARDARSDWNGYAAYTLGFLTLISSFNYLDRGILGLALPLIKAQMRVSDTLLGLVSGLAFALFYSLLGLPIAWLAERWSRRNIIAIGFAFWSLMTAFTALVANIWQLGVMRFLMGAGEACGLAPSNSMVSDLYRESRRPLALGILGVASSIAYIAFYPVIGWVGEHHGWRAMFAVCGLPGAVLAVTFLLTVREPERGACETRTLSLDIESLAAMVRFLLGSRAYVLMLAGAMFMGASAYAGATWNATFLVRVHHLSLADVAASLGPLQGLFGGAGILLGGLLTDLLGRRDERWRLRLPAIACALAGPAEALFLLGDRRLAWMTGFALTSLLTLAHQAPVFAVAMSVSKVRMRAVAVSMMVLVASLLGQIIGPLLVGMLDDRLHARLGDSAVRYSLLLVAVCAIAGGLAFAAAVRFFERDRLRAAAP
jgi:MFS family permease